MSSSPDPLVEDTFAASGIYVTVGDLSFGEFVSCRDIPSDFAIASLVPLVIGSRVSCVSQRRLEILKIYSRLATVWKSADLVSLVALRVEGVSVLF